MPAQLPLPFTPETRHGREAFIAAPSNSQALGFVERWPDWPVAAVALIGPPSSGKSHLAEIWRARSGAGLLAASALARLPPAQGGVALVIEDVDRSRPSIERDRQLFAMFERASPAAPVLLTGRTPPGRWPVVLPDLASRFSALLALSLESAEESLLEALAEKLFADRQIAVPKAVIARMLRVLERSPASIRAFVARADAQALAENGAVTLALVRRLVGESETGTED